MRLSGFLIEGVVLAGTEDTEGDIGCAIGSADALFWALRVGVPGAGGNTRFLRTPAGLWSDIT
jgi:hypothetical protein